MLKSFRLSLVLFGTTFFSSFFLFLHSENHCHNPIKIDSSSNITLVHNNYQAQKLFVTTSTWKSFNSVIGSIKNKKFILCGSIVFDHQQLRNGNCFLNKKITSKPASIDLLNSLLKLENNNLLINNYRELLISDNVRPQAVVFSPNYTGNNVFTTNQVIATKVNSFVSISEESTVESNTAKTAKSAEGLGEKFLKFFSKDNYKKHLKTYILPGFAGFIAFFAIIGICIQLIILFLHPGSGKKRLISMIIIVITAAVTIGLAVLAVFFLIPAIVQKYT